MRGSRVAPRPHALVDASGYFALLDRGDHNHAQALAIRDRLVADGWHLYTTSFILAETHALLLARLNQPVATQFLREMEASPTTLVWVSQADVQRARSIIYRYEDKDFSLTDATSFAVMERLLIPYAFAFDRHFSQFGLTVLAPA